MADEPSLVIGFDVTRTQAALRTVPECRGALGQLVASFPSGRMTDRLSAAVPIDGFLSSLSALGTWPLPDSVIWEDDFRLLVTEMLDTTDMAERLLSGSPDEDTVEPESVPALLGDDWTGSLTPFQLRDIARLLSVGHGANFSVPGAGKTRVSLAAFSALRRRGSVARMLVVSPKSAYEAWQDEAKQCFSTPLDVQVLGKAVPASADILLVNYERLDRALAGLSQWLKTAPAMLILDEAHRMKLGGAGVYGAACMALGPLSRVRMILSGTPAPNGAKDLENLFSFVWPGHGRRVVTQAVDGGDLAHASQVLRPLYTRTTKDELGLPPVETRVRRIPMPPLHREIYDALMGDFSARAAVDRSDFEALGRTALRLLMAATSPALLVAGSTRHEPLPFRVPPLEAAEGDSLTMLLRQLPDYELSPKYQETLSIVSANAAAGRKTLVWTSFVRSITSLQALLEPFQPAAVHGGTPDREAELHRFREDPDCTVLISNPATLGEGISLHQVCHDAVYVDRDFQAGRFLQSLDRIHRLGLDPGTQTRVTVLAAKDSVDDLVAFRLAEKLDFMGRILDDPEVQQLGDPEEEVPLAAGMDAADVRALLEYLGTEVAQPRLDIDS
ncbi:DEAD/DEAH box helicase [Streptomyces sp. S1A1-7]|uniref:DEAD/DEAH box helicase n=1 Tax=Streptomyces sp. S1A1-7 TaxID=2594459 RepID=UPI0011641F3E|nr:DEAD/DEAH box helicase [Streptomyces sp. S1A1-7]QDN79461.1 DEAD/DEAH box helicase [Streptomyces sp. S1A1-7]